MDATAIDSPPAPPAYRADRAAWEGSSLRWLYLDLNSYFASVEQQENPRLRNKPVIVVPLMTDATSAIAASYEAKAFGIKTGTPVWEAKRICPGLQVVPARHDLYVRYHERIKEEIDRHVPVSESSSIDEMACELMGAERIKPEAEALARRIKRGILGRVGDQLRCSIGIAPNRFLAKVASDMQKPDGLVVIERHELPHRLLHLKLRDLPGIGANMERRLLEAGIGSVQDLWDMDLRKASEAWNGVVGERFWHWLRGEGDYQQSHARRSISHSHVLPPEHRGAERALLVLRRLTVKCGSRLRRMGYVASGLGISLRFENDRKWHADFRLTETQDSFVLLDAVERLWAAMRRETGGGRFRKVGLWISGLMPQSETTLDLFGGGSGFEASPASAAARVKLCASLDKLNAKYGKDTVHIGPLPGGPATPFMGAKIAFNRIPEMQEFLE